MAAEPGWQLLRLRHPAARAVRTKPGHLGAATPADPDRRTGQRGHQSRGKTEGIEPSGGTDVMRVQAGACAAQWAAHPAVEPPLVALLQERLNKEPNSEVAQSCEEEPNTGAN